MQNPLTYVTETTVLAVHDQLVSYIFLSFVFDTIDHSSLLHRLSYRFGITGAALCRIKSLLFGLLRLLLIIIFCSISVLSGVQY